MRKINYVLIMSFLRSWWSCSILLFSFFFFAVSSENPTISKEKNSNHIAQGWIWWVVHKINEFGNNSEFFVFFNRSIENQEQFIKCVVVQHKTIINLSFTVVQSNFPDKPFELNAFIVVHWNRHILWLNKYYIIESHS